MFQQISNQKNQNQFNKITQNKMHIYNNSNPNLSANFYQQMKQNIIRNKPVCTCRRMENQHFASYSQLSPQNNFNKNKMQKNNLSFNQQEQSYARQMMNPNSQNYFSPINYKPVCTCNLNYNINKVSNSLQLNYQTLNKSTISEINNRRYSYDSNLGRRKRKILLFHLSEEGETTYNLSRNINLKNINNSKGSLKNSKFLPHPTSVYFYRNSDFINCTCGKTEPNLRDNSKLNNSNKLCSQCQYEKNMKNSNFNRKSDLIPSLDKNSVLINSNSYQFYNNKEYNQQIINKENKNIPLNNNRYNNLGINTSEGNINLIEMEKMNN